MTAGARSAGPLSGRTVVVTRAEHQASSLTDRLTALGADVLAVPVIAVAEPSDGGAGLRDALARLEQVDWLVVTSANGVERVVDATSVVGADLASVSLAAVGPGTRDALNERGLDVALVPERFVAEGLLEVFPAPPGHRPGRVLLAQADGARPVLREGLAATGWQVDVVEAYRTVHPPVSADLVARAAAADAVTFTSASTVRGFVAAAGVDVLPPVVVTIGPVTSAEAARLEVPVTAEADPHTIPGLAAAVVDALAAR
jgi:uroporphyrinogen-III synthase